MHVSMRTLLPTFTFKTISSGSMVYQVLHGHQAGMTTPILYVTKEATKVIQQDGGRVWDRHPALTPRLAFSHWILSKPKRNQLQTPLESSAFLVLKKSRDRTEIPSRPASSLGGWDVSL